jgi:L-amino acid N-acyltransferase YncA
METDIAIRPAVPGDAEALLGIYAPYVEKTAITFEYTVPSAAEFRGRIEHTLQKYPYLTASCGGKAVGYAYAGPFGSRAAYDWAVETSIYVSFDKRRAGIGRRLYAALEACLAAQGILNLNACIAYPPSGADDEYLTSGSVSFHEKLGYRMVGRFSECGYKFGRWYDMVWMEKHIGPHLAVQPPVVPFPRAAGGVKLP